MFPLVSAATIVPVLFIAFFALDSYALLLVGGFFLGIGGTAFAVGRAVRQRLVPAGAPRARDRHLRRRHGRHRDQRAHHREARTPTLGDKAPFLITAVVLAVYAVVAWLVLRDAPGRAVPDDLACHPALGQRSAADHLAGLHPLRRRVRRVRRVLGLPAGLPQDRLRPDPGRRREPDGRLRRGRRDHAARRRLAVRPVRPDPGAGRRLRRRRGRCRGLPPARRRSTRIGTVAFLAMAAALGRGSGATFALVAQVTDPAGSAA